MKLLATCLVLGVSAATAARVLHEHVPSVPEEWEAKRRSPRDIQIELTVAVRACAPPWTSRRCGAPKG